MSVQSVRMDSNNSAYAAAYVCIENNPDQVQQHAKSQHAQTEPYVVHVEVVEHKDAQHGQVHHQVVEMVSMVHQNQLQHEHAQHQD